MTHNDKVILTLKDEITAKKMLLKNKDLRPKTNLVLTFNGHKHNLNVLTKFELLYLTSQLIGVKQTLFNMGVEDTIEIDGFPIEDWIDDLKGKYIILKNKIETKNLEEIEKRLDNLISSDLKTNLELNDIRKLLGL